MHVVESGTYALGPITHWPQRDAHYIHMNMKPGGLGHAEGPGAHELGRGSGGDLGAFLALRCAKQALRHATLP